jgi:hypothetical protein
MKNIAEAVFGVGDLLVLQVTDDSPLLRRPPLDYYQKLAKVSSSSIISRKSSLLHKNRSFVRDVEGNPMTKSHSATMLVDTLENAASTDVSYPSYTSGLLNNCSTHL